MASQFEFGFDFASLQHNPWGNESHVDTARSFFAPGLFADLTNVSGQPKSTTPSPSDDGLLSQQTGESPGAAIAQRMVDLVVSPEPCRQRPQSVTVPASLVLPTPLQKAPKILIVEYKKNHRQRISCPPEVKVLENDFVIIQLQQNTRWAGDVPPLDVAQVIGIYSQADRHLVPRTLGYDAGFALRVADASDCEVINNVLPDLEAKALRLCHQLINFLNAPFVAEDAEYSFDRRQVRLFCSLCPNSSTSNAPNVRRLQKELSVRLRCRVLLEQLKPENIQSA